MTDDRLTSDELFAIFKGLIPTPVAFYLMNGGAKLDRSALEMVQAVREQATNDRIEAQAAEIERLQVEAEADRSKGAFEIKERVVLSSLEREMAGMIGMTPVEYGKGKLHLAGCKDERAKIVDWLRKEQEDHPKSEYSGFVAMIAEGIEAGEHLK
jgi:hypothetical protein